MKTNLNHKNVYYGQLVDLASQTGDRKNPRDFSRGYATGVKVHYFNRKGVLVGREYEFVPYEYIRAHGSAPYWQNNFTGKRFEKLRQWWFEFKCRIVTRLIRNTYKS